MARKLKPDKLLFWATLLLVSAGLVMVYSASASLAQEQYGQPYWYLWKQATFLAVGLLCLIVLMHVDYRTYQQPLVIWTALALVAVALVAVLFGELRNNTHRWFVVFGITVQPSEFAKLAVILFTADMLNRRMEQINDLRQTILPIALVIGSVVGFVFVEPDFGTGFVILFITAIMIFAAGLRYRHLALLSAAVIPVVGGVLVMAPYRVQRLVAFLDPWKDAEGSGFQVVQSMIAVGTGGWTGRSLMQGIQKLFYLPEPHSDFIFAVIGEELGFVGATVMVVAYAVIAWRGLHVSVNASDRFGAFLALGITVAIAVQAFFNISVVLGLLPTKGIPLPFVSAGGSSLIASLVAMGVLLNVSQHSSVNA